MKRKGEKEKSELERKLSRALGQRSQGQREFKKATSVNRGEKTGSIRFLTRSEKTGSKRQKWRNWP